MAQRSSVGREVVVVVDPQTVAYKQATDKMVFEQRDGIWTGRVNGYPHITVGGGSEQECRKVLCGLLADWFFGN